MTHSRNIDFVALAGKATPLYACICISDKDTMIMLVLPSTATMSRSQTMYLRKITVLARYRIHNKLWIQLEDYYHDLFNADDISNSLLLTHWMTGTMHVGAGMSKGDDALSGDMNIHDSIDIPLLRDPETVIRLWDIGVALIHEAKDYGFDYRVPKSKPDPLILQMRKI